MRRDLNESEIRSALQRMAEQAERTARPSVSVLGTQRTRRSGTPRRLSMVVGIVAACAVAGAVIVVAPRHRAPSVAPSTSLDMADGSTVPPPKGSAETSVSSSTPVTVPLRTPPPPEPWDPSTIPSTVVAGRRLVVIGLTTSSRTVVQILDLDTRTWTQAPPVPTLESGAIAGNATGAWTGTEVVYPGASLDPVQLTWKSQTGFDPNPNFQRWWATWTGREVVMLPGGQRYDPASDRWSVIGDTPPDLRGSAPIWTGDDIVAADGSGIWWAYRPAQAIWTQLPAGPNPSNGTATWDGSRIVVITTDLVTYAYSPSDMLWSVGAPVPLTDCWPTIQSVPVGSSIVTHGDRCGAAVLNGDRWRQIELPIGQSGCLSAADSSDVFDQCASSVISVG